MVCGGVWRCVGGGCACEAFNTQLMQLFFRKASFWQMGTDLVSMSFRDIKWKRNNKMDRRCQEVHMLLDATDMNWLD